MLRRFKNNSSVFLYMAAFVFLSSLTFSFVSADTGVPNTISYQGRLTDSGGNALGGSGTTYYFKFSIWDNPTVGSGTKLWPASNPNSTTLTVRQGSFSVDIGDTDNGYPDVLDYNFNTNSKVYLQIEVSGDNTTFETLTPRSAISSAAFSQVASSVNGTGDSSFGTSTPFLNTLISALSTNVNKAVMVIKGAVGQVANLFNVTDSNNNSFFTVAANGNVGVGTSTPVNKLDVIGTVGITSNSNWLNLNSTGALWAIGAGNEATPNIYIGAQGSVRNNYFWRGNWSTGGVAVNTFRNAGGSLGLTTVNIPAVASQTGDLFAVSSESGSMGNLFKIQTNGNVGIGTTTPSATLDVWGSLTVGQSSLPLISASTSTGRFQVNSSSATGMVVHGGGAGTALWLAPSNQPLTNTPVLKNAIVSVGGLNGSFGRSDMRFVLNNTTGGGTADFTTDAKMTIQGSTGNVGIGTTTPIERLSVIGNGQFTAVGSGAYAFDLNLTSTGVLTTSASDNRLKENIMTISSTSTLEKISLLRPVTFDWKTNGSHDIGLIAQEVELIFPELVFTNPTDGYKGVNYSRFTALLISSIQEISGKLNQVMAWFKDGKFNVQSDVCVDDVCISKEQFKQILINSQPVINTTSTPTPSPSPEPVIEPEVIPEPEIVEPEVVTEPEIVEPVAETETVVESVSEPIVE